MIQVKDLHKSFGKNNVLTGISTDIKKGEVVVVIGPSGSGKSTFLRSLNLLEQPTSGSIIFDGDEITDPKTNIDLHRQKMGMVFQHFNLFPQMCIRDRGDTYCTEREQWLVKLAGFPPLSYGCYPSAPKKYIVPKEHLWVPDEEGIKVLEEIAAEAEDMSLVHSLKTYRKYASECVSNPVLARVMAKWIAVKLHRKSHAKTCLLYTSQLSEEGRY